MNGDTTVLPATAIAVVVSRGKHTSLEISVAAQIPVKRKHVNDTVQFVLEHYEFMEDRRYLSHLDALLGRLAPLSCIHLGCTETAEVSFAQQYPKQHQTHIHSHISSINLQPQNSQSPPSKRMLLLIAKLSKLRIFWSGSQTPFLPDRI